jgi:hypothetical protein
MIHPISGDWQTAKHSVKRSTGKPVSIASDAGVSGIPPLIREPLGEHLEAT